VSAKVADPHDFFLKLAKEIVQKRIPEIDFKGISFADVDGLVKNIITENQPSAIETALVFLPCFSGIPTADRKRVLNAIASTKESDTFWNLVSVEFSRLLEQTDESKEHTDRVKQRIRAAGGNPDEEIKKFNKTRLGSFADVCRLYNVSPGGPGLDCGNRNQFIN